jgi:hypothetical protein
MASELNSGDKQTKLRKQPKEEQIENADLRAPPKFAPEVN